MNNELENINKHLTLCIKVMVMVALLSGTFISVNLYSDTLHTGPSCSKQQLQHWYGKKGEIVSVHEAKNQPKEGETICYGTVELKNGGYKDWDGVITDTDVGLIGWAR